MSQSTEALLAKAVLNVTGPGGDVGTQDFGGGGQAPLSVEQVTAFIEVMAAEQVMLGEVRTVTSSSAKWQESIISFADRITRPGIEATRLAAGDRKKPVTGLVEISTVLVRAEIPVSDETFEDNVAGQNLTSVIERLITDRFGFDLEDLFVNGDTSNVSDDYLAQTDGWLVESATGNVVDCTSFGQDYQEIFRVLLTTLPKKFLRNRAKLRYFVPITLEQKYRDILASRGTPLGDAILQGNIPLTYQGIPITSAASFDAGIVPGGPDTASVLLTSADNLYAGYHRAMKFETWRDPREGATSFIVTARVDPKVALPDATVCGQNVDVEV
jgi:HK97 family phage major capsid protein